MAWLAFASDSDGYEPAFRFGWRRAARSTRRPFSCFTAGVHRCTCTERRWSGSPRHGDFTVIAPDLRGHGFSDKANRTACLHTRFLSGRCPRVARRLRLQSRDDRRPVARRCHRRDDFSVTHAGIMRRGARPDHAGRTYANADTQRWYASWAEVSPRDSRRTWSLAG